MHDVAPTDVLVVEDDPDLNEMIGAYVRLAGYTYRPALDGDAAVRALRERAPALVLLDLMLPGIDGFEVCRRMRADEATRNVPVVILSAVNEPDARRRAQELDVREYITKPFDPDALMDALHRYAPVGGA